MSDTSDQFTRRQKIRSYLSQLDRWFHRVETPVYFVAVVLFWLGACWLGAFFFHTQGSEATIQWDAVRRRSVRRAGFLLELTSIAILLWRLGLLQALFDKTAWWWKPWEWIKDLPTSYIAGTLYGKRAFTETRMDTAKVSPDYGYTEDMEERVGRLEQKVKCIGDKIDNLEDELKGEIEDLRQEFQEYQSEHDRQLEQISSLLEKVSIDGDGLTWELMALGWLLAGSIFTNEPGLIVAGLKLLPIS